MELNTEIIKLLIVESEDELREVMVDFFSLNGVHVVTAQNISEALKIMLNEKIDVILSEIRMSGGGGIELLHELKKVSEISPLFWFMNSRPDMSTEDALLLGAQGIYHKPFRLAVALEEILKTVKGNIKY